MAQRPAVRAMAPCEPISSSVFRRFDLQNAHTHTHNTSGNNRQLAGGYTGELRNVLHVAGGHITLVFCLEASYDGELQVGLQTALTLRLLFSLRPSLTDKTPTCDRYGPVRG